MKNLWKKIERLAPFLIFSMMLLLLLIGSNFSIFLFYILLFFVGVFLLVYVNRRKKLNQKTGGLFVISCSCLAMYGLLDSISQLLKFIRKDQIGELESLSHAIHVYDSFLGSLTFFLFGIVLVSKRVITEMGWLQNQMNNQQKIRSVRNFKIVGTLMILMSLAVAIRTAYVYFVLIPDLKHYLIK